MLKHIFLDLDDTILNFTAGEASALSQALKAVGIQPTQAILDRYHVINQFHWQMLEAGRLTRTEVKTRRFDQLFRELGIQLSGEKVCGIYEHQISLQHELIPGARALLEALSPRYDLYLASNGSIAVQNARLDAAGIRHFFKGIFISEELGADKPSRAFFEACFAAIPDFQAENAIMVGDSLTSDIRGGINAGLRTIWFAPHGKTASPDICPTYIVQNHDELIALINQLQ